MIRLSPQILLCLLAGCVGRRTVTIAAASDREAVLKTHTVVLVGGIHEARETAHWGILENFSVANTAPAFGYTVNLVIAPIQTLKGPAPKEPFTLGNINDPHIYDPGPLSLANLRPPFQAIIAYTPRGMDPYADLVLIPQYPETTPLTAAASHLQRPAGAAI
jgi:hypothetical protein